MKVFLDLDGTLIDISERHYQVYTTTVNDFGGTPLEKARYWELKRDNTPWPEILTLSNVSLEHEPRFMEDFTKRIEDPVMLALDTLFTHSMSVLTELKKTHELILVSLRRNPQNLRTQLDQLGITKFFAHILSGHSATKEGLLTKKAAVIQELGPVGEACIVGDTEADVSAGKQLAITSIAVTTGIRSESFLSHLEPDYVSGSINQVKDIVESL